MEDCEGWRVLYSVKDPFSYISVCSGIEAATVAWHSLGWRAAAIAEIDPFPCRLLHHRLGVSRPRYMPDPAEAESDKDRRYRAAAIRACARIPEDGDIPNVGDFTRIHGGEYGAISALVGGTPCQDFSIAGLRAGMDGARGQLTVEFARLAHRLAARAGARWLVWENVPGVLSIDDGGAFAEFLGILAGVSIRPPAGGWSNSGVIPGAAGGFGLAWRVLDAQFTGVPQRRRRVFVIGYFGDWRRAAAVLFERHSLSGHPPPRRESGKAAPRGIAVGPSGGQFTDTACTLDSRAKDGPIRNQIGMLAVDWPAEVDPTLDGGLIQAFGGNNCSGPIPHGRLSFESETFITSSLDASYGRLHGASNQDANHGHSLLVPVAFRASGQDGFTPGPISPPIAASDGGGSGVPTIAIQAGCLRENPESVAVAFVQDEVRLFGDGDTVGALAAEPGAKQQCYIAFSCKDHGADAGEISPTLRSMDYDGSHANGGGQIAVAYADKGDQEALIFESRFARNGRGAPSDIVPPLKAQSGDTGKGDGAPLLALPMAVRRLTPRECERLQGFPDDYTKISSSTPDGPRYKALGNSMAVPVMRWIGERIALVDGIK